MNTTETWRAAETRHAGAYRLIVDDSCPRGFVAEVQAPVRGDRFDVAERDRRCSMISAAPDMLAALKDALRVVEAANIAGQGLYGCGAAKAARAAIAKAEGRADV